MEADSSLRASLYVDEPTVHLESETSIGLCSNFVSFTEEAAMIRRALSLTLLALLFPLVSVTAQDSSSNPPPVVEVTAKDFEFQAPERINSGWTTFRFSNTGEQEHFFVLWGVPEGKSFRDYRTEVVQPFEDVWQRYSSGELTRKETMKALGAELPSWFEKVRPSGGAALTEPGETSQVTVKLEPGTYVMECYVKTPQGTWHTSRGMLREVTVMPEGTNASPPEPDATITLSNYQIDVSGTLEPGTQTIAVNVTENPEGFIYHDLNLFRLEQGTSVQEITQWMDWMDLEQFRAPAPGYSLGGVEHLWAGNTGYMTVDLTPGRYVWVSEGYADRGMVREFTIE